MLRPAASEIFRRTGTLVLLGHLACLAGCQAPPSPEGPSEALVRLVDYDGFMDRTLTSLRELDLPPQHVDRVRGVVHTRPTTSGQWFEPWRVDARGGYQLLESSLHTIRRRVTVRCEYAGEGAPLDEFRLRVEVAKERFSSPQRQVTTASGALAIYSERLPTEEGLRASQVRGDHWVPLGRDGPLEAYLLRRIAGLAEASPAPTTAHPEAEEPTESGKTHEDPRR
jgi:hypothetical protein